MNRLRNRLIVVFLAGTLLPLGAMLWINASLLRESLSYAVTDDLDMLSKSLEQTARQLYQTSRQDLKEDAAAGLVTARRFKGSDSGSWPPAVQEFRDSGEPERFSLAGAEGDRLEYLVRRGEDVDLYERQLANIRMQPLEARLRQARGHIDYLKKRDLRRGFTVTVLLLGAGVWLLSLAALTFVAHRISRPIQDLTAGLSQLASGRYETRLQVQRRDEVGRAVEAFNNMAGQLQENRDRLVYLTQVASWQLLARKMAHELKNSLTPIRLTVEEIVARQPNYDPAFLKQAAQVVVEEIDTLERRVRAFSEFSSEPVPKPCRIDVNAILRERIEFLRVAHESLEYRIEAAETHLFAYADPDHVKGILTNLLENAADAVGGRGVVLAVSGTCEDKISLEVHDSGPGLSPEARRTLFEPAISFKKHGMGLGLSISRKNALLAGGELRGIDGRLGGAGFRLLLPRASEQRERREPQA